MKKLITMIGIGALLFLAPSCEKSNIQPIDNSATTELEERSIGQDLQPLRNKTSLYVMLSSKPCLSPQREYTALMINIKAIRFYTEQHGWQSIQPLNQSFDLVKMQSMDTGFNITDRYIVPPGTITKVALTFGDQNRLAVNNVPVNCFKLANQEVVLDMKGEIKAKEVNELLLSMDICGNISLQNNNSGDNKCYILKPLVEFQKISQKMIK